MSCSDDAVDTESDPDETPDKRGDEPSLGPGSDRRALICSAVFTFRETVSVRYPCHQLWANVVPQAL